MTEQISIRQAEVPAKAKPRSPRAPRTPQAQTKTAPTGARSTTPRSAATRSTAARNSPTEADLGAVKFEDWFETPLFESDSDERLEEMATSKRGPLKFTASAILRLEAWAASLRNRPTVADVPALANVDELGDLPSAASATDDLMTRRARISQAIDRWAEREEAAQRRLESMIVPKRWQT